MPPVFTPWNLSSYDNTTATVWEADELAEAKAVEDFLTSETGEKYGLIRNVQTKKSRCDSYMTKSETTVSTCDPKTLGFAIFKSN